eukprot:m.617683 g.617683  ORF g.617683 m.617683 type:complete len:112 (-) comp58181_c0_seq21:482-817(-)
MHLAAQHDLHGSIRILLRACLTDINLPDSHGYTPLMLASNGGTEEEDTRDGQLETVKLLLEFGAQPHLTTEDGFTAKELARQSGWHAVAELLEVGQPNQASSPDTHCLDRT